MLPCKLRSISFSSSLTLSKSALPNVGKCLVRRFRKTHTVPNLETVFGLHSPTAERNGFSIKLENSRVREESFLIFVVECVNNRTSRLVL